MPNLALQPGTPPVDSALPDTPQALLNFVAAYLGVSGLEDLHGVVLSPAEPRAVDRDKIWVKQDAENQRPLGLFAFHDTWQPIPFIVPTSTGTDSTGGRKTGELVYNSDLKALRLFDGVAWTTNFFHSGNTGSRPSNVPTHYLYFDTDINRLLRMTGSGQYTTFDGAVGDVKMVTGIDPATAAKNNPGWSVFDMAGRFPLGVKDGVSPGDIGGVALEQMKLKWLARGRSANGSSRDANASFIASLQLNGIEASADGTKMNGVTDIGAEQTVDFTPPYKAFLFLRKDF